MDKLDIRLECVKLAISYVIAKGSLPQDSILVLAKQLEGYITSDANGDNLKETPKEAPKPSPDTSIRQAKKR